MSGMVLSERRGAAGVATLNHPESGNLLTHELLKALADAMDQFERDDAIGAIVLASSAKLFSGGADKEELERHDEAERSSYLVNLLNRVGRCRKPTIAAVAGFALGGGCELALMCDIVIAAPNARFGQPEVKLGLIPGGGGTQRLIRAVGKSRAMEMCLTGGLMDAQEALQRGLVSKVVPKPQLLTAALEIAERICSNPRAAVLLAKEAVSYAERSGLEQGLAFERRLFHSLFGGQRGDYNGE